MERQPASVRNAGNNLIGLLWTVGSYASAAAPVAPVVAVCPAAPFDPATLPLSLWLDARDCPGAGIDWPSRASTGTSGNIHTSFQTGGGPQSLSKPLAVAPCGLATAQFLTSPNTVLRITDDPTNPVVPATIVYCGKFIASADPGYGPQYVGGIINDFNNRWKVQFTSSGQARVYVYTAAGGQIATTANSVATGAWYIVTIQFTASGVTIQLNHGAVASTANAWTPNVRGNMYLGFDPIFGAQFDTWLGELFISNTALSSGDTASLEAHCAWHIGTTV